MKDEVLARDKWIFDESVTNAFPDMLERSIPQYEVMRKIVFDVGRKFVRENTAIVDLGCSRGDALAPFVDEFKWQNYYTGVEVSAPMRETATKRFTASPYTAHVEIINCDLRTAYPPTRASLTLCILTAMFIPIERRHELFTKIFDHTNTGGAVVLVEKILGEGSANDAIFTDLYYKMKSGNDYTQEQIERKRLSLEGVLVPLTAKWNEEMLHWSGFRRVECFWRWMNFAAWIGVRP